MTRFTDETRPRLRQKPKLLGWHTPRVAGEEWGGRAVTWRSLTLGLVGVLFINLLTPYNLWVVNNTDLVGNFLPTGLLLFFLLFVLCVNAPLYHWRPHAALDRGELAVALCMTLVSCALPNVGLMRYLPGHLVAFFQHGSTNADYRALLEQLHLPDWLFPTFPPDATDMASRGNHEIVRDFYGRIPVDPNTFFNRVRAIPWRAWARPAMTWAIFIGSLFGAIGCLSLIFRRQWVENERLPFPLAGIYLSLIEPPPPGRALNKLFTSGGFWLAFVAVFLIHACNALWLYYPKTFPEIPLTFKLHTLFVDAPLKYTEFWFKEQRLLFTIVGISFFVQAKVAFSLWFFFILAQVARMIAGSNGGEINGAMEMDQIFGALIPLGLTILWVARHHLLAVAKQMFRPPREGEPAGRYAPYAIAGWGLIGCLAVSIGWLVVAGASVAGATVIVLMLMLMYLVLAKVVAETGLLYVLIPIPLNRPFVYAANDLPQFMQARTTLTSYFFASMFSGVLTHDFRQALPVYATTALRIGDSTIDPTDEDHPRAGRGARVKFIASLAFALALAYVVSGASELYINYAYASTLDRRQDSPIGVWGSLDMPRQIALDETLKYVPPRTGPTEAHSRPGHFTFGFALSSLLSVARLRADWWPLHPVGYLLCYTWGVRQIWFSIFVGWLAKVLVLRFGGSSLYEKSKTFCMGLILGESFAAGFWLVVNLVLSSLGYDYRAVHLLPS